jgi:hypothetical protein
MSLPMGTGQLFLLDSFFRLQGTALWALGSARVWFACFLRATGNSTPLPFQRARAGSYGWKSEDGIRRRCILRIQRLMNGCPSRSMLHATQGRHRLEAAATRTGHRAPHQSPGAPHADCVQLEPSCAALGRRRLSGGDPADHDGSASARRIHRSRRPS